ncbi:cobalt-precorrin-6A reductase [Nocardioides marmoriginsengisoli]|uniref:Cobalt-precorrin-6A reductase n=1 Tax=Nocardioides marmoriginsengisoli TaxID=661483 RepID=A0A3N0CBF6_9ACTN|nr:cobalt-precorrin-6A reductase [Nocardioides marmoriginsengisoli]RNL60768.1 cobalt-precorrin-6A reductase [Nocardioides marmoriginsengisoli]
MKVLVLGGTAEAREVAALLLNAGVDLTSSLAGRVARPRLPVGPVRIGGFGGVDGLIAYLRDQAVTAVVDATHPFAAGISANATAACAAVQVPLLRLERPGWGGAPQAETWHWVDTHEEAAAVAARLGARPFLTIGRQSLGSFVPALGRLAVTARVVDEPDLEVPASWRILLSRGPYELASEKQLLVEAGADVLVTKDSGGDWTWPKMAAAGELGIPVVVVRRKPAVSGVEVVGDPAAAAAWVIRSSG